MTRTQLYLPESQYEELKRIAVSHKQTFASFVRDIIDEKLKEIKKPKKIKLQNNVISSWLSSLKKVEKWKEKGVIRRGSTEHDQILYGKNGLL